MFVAALFTIGRTWKQPRCPPTDEMDKDAVAHIYSGVFAAAAAQLLSHV